MNFQSAEFIDLIHEAPRLFGRLLDELCKRAGLHQAHLSKLADAVRKELIATGVILPGDSLIGSMYQPAISRVMSGEQRPTYGQVLIWLDVIRDWYKSDQLRRACKTVELEYNIEMDIPEFEPWLETHLWNLALFGKPHEIAASYEECKNLRLLDENLPSLIDARTSNLPTVRQKRQELEKQTDINLPITGRITKSLNKDTDFDLHSFSPRSNECCSEI